MSYEDSMNLHLPDYYLDSSDNCNSKWSDVDAIRSEVIVDKSCADDYNDSNVFKAKKGSK